MFTWLFLPETHFQGIFKVFKIGKHQPFSFQILSTQLKTFFFQGLEISR